MKEFEFDWLEENAGNLALSGFQQYMKSGKGVIEVELKPDSEPKFRYSRYHQLEHYDPNTQILIKINDNPRQICTHNVNVSEVYKQLSKKLNLNL